MAVDRSDIDHNHSFHTVGDVQFYIEPEFLTLEEIQHELKIRQLNAEGDMRTASARLRAEILNEKRNPGAQKIISVGQSRNEFEVVNRSITKLRVYMDEVTLDPVSHTRFMSVWLHMMGRLNRIQDPSMSQVIYSVNQELEGIYNAFLNRIRTLLRFRQRNTQHSNNVDTNLVVESDNNAQVTKTIATTESNPPQMVVSTEQGGLSENLAGRGDSTAVQGDQLRLSEAFTPVGNIRIDSISRNNNQDGTALNPLANEFFGDFRSSIATNPNLSGPFREFSEDMEQYQNALAEDNFGNLRRNSFPAQFGHGVRPSNTFSNVQNNQVRNNTYEVPREQRVNESATHVQMFERMANAIADLTSNINRMSQQQEALNQSLSTNMRELSLRMDRMSSNNGNQNHAPAQVVGGGRNIDSRPIHQPINDAGANSAQGGRYDRQTVPVHKWGWKFSADKNAKEAEKRELTAFLRKVEVFREAERLTYEDIHRKFHFLVEGSVYDWYMRYKNTFTNWQQLVEGMKRQYTTPLTAFHKIAALNERRQKREENTMDYIASIQHEFDELGMSNEQEKIAIIQNGLRENLRNVAMSQQWHSVQQMDLHLRTVEVADELRRETDLKARRGTFVPRKNVHAIESKEGVENIEDSPESIGSEENDGSGTENNE